MKKFIKKLETEADVINIIETIDYGSTYFICENEDIISYLEDCLRVINESLSAQVVRFEQEGLIDILNDYGRKYGDGLCKIISSRPKDKLPELSEDSYNIRKFLNDAFNNKRKVNFYLDPSLHNYAKRLAKKDVMFDVDDVSAFFWGVNKELSVYDQIKKAFYSGEDSIKFDVQTVSVATIRCYTSTLSKMSGNKFRCNIVEGFVIVYFKPISDVEDARNRIIPILKTLKSKEAIRLFLTGLILEFTYSETEKEALSNTKEFPKPATIPEGVSIVRRLYGKPVSEEEYRSAANWQRAGYASEYNWENDIRGDVDMYPKDVRMEDYNEDDDEDHEPTKYNWDNDSDETDVF